MNTKTISNSNLHFGNMSFGKLELLFWKDELKFFNNRLSELVTRYTKKEILIQLEHFQNEFILHGGVIEDLLETMNVHEIRIAGQLKAGIDALDITLVQKHLDFRDKIETQRAIYADLKKRLF